MLYIHTSNHLEQLQKQYAELVKTPLKNVLQTETIIVQNAGMARWLSMGMANSSGINANTEYLFPAEFMWRLLRQISPDIPEHSQCAPDTLRFHIYDEIVRNFADYPELNHYILKPKNDIVKQETVSEPDSDLAFNHDNYNDNKKVDHLNTWELSCQTARLLDQYLFYRSEWIDEWENQSSNNSNNSSSLHSNHWQARLWNRCVKDKGLLHWLKLQKQFARDIESFDASLLNERISFFSMSALSPGYVDLIAGISQKTDIHIFIINPCEDVYWGDIQSPKAYSKLDQVKQSTADIGNPLLASLGKQGRDFIDKLLDIQDQGVSDSDHEYGLDTLSEPFPKLGSLLAQIQQDIYNLEQPTFIEDYDPTEASIQFHSCHTAMREVEVLHDQILAQLDANENLTPSDIVVMMPDIEKYAPYIESVFSNIIPIPVKKSEKNQVYLSKQKLPFSIADRDPQNIFKIVQALNKLFNLPDFRFDVEAVFELLEYDDIRNHFGLNEEDLNYCRDLALATNIRWGISDKSRKQNNLPDTEEHTWKYSLDRMLLGYSLSNTSSDSESLFQSDRSLQLLPYCEIEGSDTLILAKFKKFTDTIFSINDWQKQTHSLEEWIVKTTKLLKQFSPENSDQERIFNVIADIQVKANLAEFNQELPFTVYQKMLQQNLSEISASEKYLGYGITFCALVPMRSVPFKIVALMGMNDGEFPRQDSRPSFDLMAKQTRRGDRSRRDEDRYLFLESILASRSKLIISFIGQSIKDNKELPPSILVSELLDTLTLSTGIDADGWIVKHPLQAFSSRYFSSIYSPSSKVSINDSLGDLNENHPLFSYASQYLELDNNIDAGTKGASSTSFISGPLEALDDEYKSISLHELITFFKNPSRAFLKTRFGIQTYDDDKELTSREPFELEFFKDQEIRKLILSKQVTLNEEDSKEIKYQKEQITRAKGLLPYGEIGESIFTKEKKLIELFDDRLPELEKLPSEYFTLAFEGINNFELKCNIDNLTDIGRCVTQVGQPYSGDYIALWLTHLCMNAQQSKQASLQVNLTSFYSPEISFQLEPLVDAKAQLSRLIDYYWNGLHSPLAFFPKSSFALYNKKGKPSIADMSTKWNGNALSPGEKKSFEHWLLHRNLTMDADQQSDEFMQISEDVFGQLFTAKTDL